MSDRFDISILLPAHNEQQLITSVCEDISQSCKVLGLKYQLIVIENGSTDATWELVENAAKKDRNIVPVKVEQAGYGLAMLTGLNHAKADFIVVFNVDFWDQRFLSVVKADMMGYDIISSSKLLPASNDRRPFSRRAVTFLYNKFINIFMGYAGTDTHGIKLFRMQSMLPVIKKCKTKSGIFDSELMIRAQRAGLKMLELPVDIAEIRAARFSMSRWLQTPKDIWQLYKALQ